MDLDLSHREISSTVFDTCTFNACDLSETLLSQCKFLDCRFLKCNLSVVKVTDSKFVEVSFRDCKLIGIDWTLAAWSKFAPSAPIKCYNCMLNDSSFFGLKLDAFVLEACQAHTVDFREGHFQKANFKQTDFSNSMFGETDLTQADFTDATNYRIDLRFNKVRQAKFSRYEALRLLDPLDIKLVD